MGKKIPIYIEKTQTNLKLHEVIMNEINSPSLSLAEKKS